MTYAFFTADIEGNEEADESVVITGTLRIEFNDTQIISLENALPGASQTKTFTVSNTGTSPVTYNIRLVEITNTFLNNELVYSITSTNNGGTKSETTIPQRDRNIVSEITINPGIIQSYTITILFKETGENQNINQGAIFNGKLQLNEIEKITEIASGYNHTTFLTQTNKVLSAGSNGNGQLGTTKPYYNSPLYVEKINESITKYLTNVKSVTAGDYHTIFLLEDGTVWSVGYNADGQLGDGTTEDRIYPVQIKKDETTYLTGVKSVTAGDSHTIFLLEDGTVWSVGSNYFGQLGDGTTEDRIYPVQVKKDSTTYLTGVKSITAKTYHTIFLLEDGTVWSVGDNYSGQLGDGTNTQRSYPVQIKKDSTTYLTGVKSVTAGESHTVFLLEDGTVWSVGYNDSGQLGDGTKTDKSYPVQVKKDETTYLTGVKSITAGHSHTIFLLEDGTVWSVGWNYFGQLGDGTTTDKSYPVQVKKNASTYLTGVKSVAAGDYHTIFLLEDGTVWSVGRNNSGQLGDGTTEDRIYPVQVKKDSTTYLTEVKSITAGGSHTVFLLEDGTVWSVGANYSGQLGDGTTEDKSYPVKVLINGN